MDYSLITEEEISRRFESAPSAISNLLNSADERKTIDEISRTHYLNEDKRIVLEQLVGLTLLGFISLSELATEISSEIPLNFQHSRALAKEMDEKIFSSVRDDLKNIYSPLKESEDLWESEAEKEEHEPISPPLAFRPPVRGETLGEETAQLKDGPFMIHEEKSFTEEKKKSSFLGFPLNLIKPRRKSEEVPARAVFEAPHNILPRKKEEKRVVHYSELRTPVSPFNKEGGDVVKFQPKEEIKTEPEVKPAEIKKIPQPNIKGFWHPELAKVEEGAREEKPQPKIEGNTVDLR